MARLSDPQYRELLQIKVALRRFHRWSELQARSVGLTPAQHQLLLAIRGHDGDSGPTIGDLADYLLLRHHSVVELVDRGAAAGIVRRVPDTKDGRVIRVRLTRAGQTRVNELSAVHVQELHRFAPLLAHLGLPVVTTLP